MKEQLEKIKVSALDEISSAADLKAIDDIRVKYLGKKGELTAILKQMGSLSPEERPKMGQLVNTVKAELEEVISSTVEKLKAAATEAKLLEETVDITMPSKKQFTITFRNIF